MLVLMGWGCTYILFVAIVGQNPQQGAEGVEDGALLVAPAQQHLGHRYETVFLQYDTFLG